MFSRIYFDQRPRSLKKRSIADINFCLLLFLSTQESTRQLTKISNIMCSCNDWVSSWPWDFAWPCTYVQAPTRWREVNATLFNLLCYRCFGLGKTRKEVNVQHLVYSETQDKNKQACVLEVVHEAFLDTGKIQSKLLMGGKINKPGQQVVIYPGKTSVYLDLGGLAKRPCL